jgi:hypothetical protein
VKWHFTYHRQAVAIVELEVGNGSVNLGHVGDGAQDGSRME